MHNTMKYLLIGILMICGYVYLFQAAARRTTNKAALPLIAVLLLVFYGIVAIPAMVIIGSFGSLDTFLMALLMLLSCAVFFTGISALFRHRRSVNWGMTALFLVYALAVGYITIFSRDGVSNDTSVLLSFDSIKEAMDTRSLEPLNHLFLNIVLFVPFGFLLTQIDPDRCDRIGLAAMHGLMCSMIIESVQLFLHIGQCDVEDLAGNTAGAVVGVLLYRLLKKLRKAEK